MRRTSVHWTPLSPVSHAFFQGKNYLFQAIGFSVMMILALVFVCELSITAQLQNMVECNGGTNTRTVTVAGGAGPLIYPWYQSPNETTRWTHAIGSDANTSTFTLSNITRGTTYYRI